MNKKIMTIFILVLVGVFAISGCAGSENAEDEMEPMEDKVEQTEMEHIDDSDTEEKDTENMDENDSGMEELMLTLDELSMYNGKDGNKAYVAYDGIIYDVTDDSQWKSGSHGGNMAGTDITEMLNSAPHGASKVDSLTAVGKLVE